MAVMSTAEQSQRPALVIPRLLTEQQVSEITTIPVRTLQDWRYRPPMRVKVLPYTRIGGKIRYREDIILKWLDENTGVLGAQA